MLNTTYGYDSLDRVTDVTYPAQFGITTVGKTVHHSFDIASRLQGLTYNGTSPRARARNASPAMTAVIRRSWIMPSIGWGKPNIAVTSRHLSAALKFRASSQLLDTLARRSGEINVGRFPGSAYFHAQKSIEFACPTSLWSLNR